MTRRSLVPVLSLLAVLAAPACGPVLGQLSRATEGTSIRDVSGSPGGITAGSRLVILAPFPKTAEAFYIVKGEDERQFAAEFARLGLFKAETRFGPAMADGETAFKGIAAKTPAAVKAELGLASEPDILLTGTLLSRKTYVAPTRGVVMGVSWRMTFHDLRNGHSWTFDAESKELAEMTIPRIVEAIGKRIGR